MMVEGELLGMEPYDEGSRNIHRPPNRPGMSRRLTRGNDSYREQ